MHSNDSRTGRPRGVARRRSGAAAVVAVALVLKAMSSYDVGGPEALVATAAALVPDRLTVQVRNVWSAPASLEVVRLSGQVATDTGAFIPVATSVGAPDSEGLQGSQGVLRGELRAALLELIAPASNGEALEISVPATGGIPPLTSVVGSGAPSTAASEAPRAPQPASAANLLVRGWEARERDGAIEVLRKDDEASAIPVVEGMALGELGTVVEVSVQGGRVTVRTSLGGVIEGGRT